MASSNQCIVIGSCNSASHMDCKNRNFKECNFFKQLLSEWCKWHLAHCSNCKYKSYCEFQEKHGGRNH